MHITIDAFAKALAENPELVTNCKVLAVRKVALGHVDIHSDFFDSFQEDYGGDAFG